MRKSLFIFAIIALISFVSCLKEDIPQNKVEPAKIAKTIELEVSFYEPDDTDPASQSVAGPDVKAGIGEYDQTTKRFPFTWDEGDLVKVFVGDQLLQNRGVISVNPNDPTKGRVAISFTEDEIPTETSGDITLLYPGTASSPTALEAGMVRFTLPASQFAGSDGLPYNGWGDINDGMGTQLLPCLADVGPAINVYNEERSGAVFRNPLALVAFQFDETLADIQRVVLEVMHKPMGSDFIITTDFQAGQYKPSYPTGDDYNSYISLKAGKRTGDTEAVFETGKTYYMLAPSISLNDGFAIKLHRTNGEILVRGSKKLFLELRISSVNTLGTFKSSSFALDEGFVTTDYAFTTDQKARLAVVGSYLIVANGTSVLKFYDRFTGNHIRDLDVSKINGGSAGVDMLSVDDAGHLVFGKSGDSNIYYMLSTIGTAASLGTYTASTLTGNLRVSGDVEKQAVITLFTQSASVGALPSYMAFNVNALALGSSVSGLASLPAGASGSTIWSCGYGAVHPLGNTINDGLFYIGYNGERYLEYAENETSEFSSTNIGLNGNDNPGSIDVAMVNGKRYLAVGVGSFFANTVPRVKVVDVTNSPKFVNTWAFSPTALTGAGAWSDVQIVPSPSEPGYYYVYYLSANNGILACKKFGPEDSSDAPEIVNVPKVIAHRGYHPGDVAENSIESLEEAQNIACYGCEMDFYITTDNVVVAYHDVNITVNSTEKKIYECSYEEIKNIALSNGEVIPTLEDVLNQLSTSKTTRLILEFKDHWSEDRNNAVVDNAVNLINSKDMSDMVDYISFNYDMCLRVAAAMPNAEVGLLDYGDADKSPADLAETVINSIDYSYYAYNNNPTWIEDAHNLGLTVGVWTINNSDNDTLFDTWIKSGVDYITTDEPVLLQQTIDAYILQNYSN